MDLASSSVEDDEDSLEETAIALVLPPPAAEAKRDFAALFSMVPKYCTWCAGESRRNFRKFFSFFFLLFLSLSCDAIDSRLGGDR